MPPPPPPRFVPRFHPAWLLLPVAAAAAPLPLVGVWGYESSLVFAPLLALAAGADAIVAVHRLRRRAEGSWAAVLRAGLAGCGRILAAVLLGLGLAPLFQRVCDPWGGLAMFLAGAGGSCVVGWWTGALSAVFFRRHGRAAAVFVAVFLGSSALALARLYEGPAVFAYDPFWGYFAGAIYDEHVDLGPVYGMFRLYNALSLASVTCLAVLLRKPPCFSPRRPVLTRAAIPVGIALAGTAAFAIRLGLSADARGFTASYATMDEVLPRTLRTEHFVLHYAPQTVTHREIRAIAVEHEFAFAELARRLGRTPRTPIHSFLFDSPEQKRAVMGAGRVEVAPPWRGHLYLHHKPFPPASLFHELAHLFEMPLGDPIFGLSLGPSGPRMGIVEGLATALADPVVDDLSIHEQAAVLSRLGKLPPLSRLLGPGFWTLAGRHAYTAAGSFMAFVVERFGIDAAVSLYANGGDVEAALGLSLEEAARRWRAFLDGVALPEGTVEAHAERFRVRSIVARPCAHRIARLAAAAARDRRRGKDREVLAHLDRICRLDPGEPRHAMARAYELAAQGRLAEADRGFAGIARNRDLPAALRAEALEQRARIALLRGEVEAARTAVRKARSLDVPPPLGRRIELVQRAADEAGPRPWILRYLRPYDRTEDGTSLLAGRIYAALALAERPDTEPLGHYLAGLQLAAVGVHDLARTAFARASARVASGARLSPAFARALADRRLASALAAFDLRAAEAALADLRKTLPATDGARRFLARNAARIRAFARALEAGAPPGP